MFGIKLRSVIATLAFLPLMATAAVVISSASIPLYPTRPLGSGTSSKGRQEGH